MTQVDLRTAAANIGSSIETVVEGKPGAIRLALTVLLAEGHLLIEDVPGVGKTLLAKALARSLDATARRIQFTPDLLPGDVTGVSIFDQETHHFEFRPGAVFANFVLADEINRASPKTQSALLECMEERQVTVDGTTYPLPPPFMVVATQNPIEMEGTYPLPEAQRDRFMARIDMGYPDTAAEIEMLAVHGTGSPLTKIVPVADTATISALIEAVRGVYVSPSVAAYAVALSTSTRNHRDLRLGASPRATLHLVRAAKAGAALSGRDHVLPDDLQALAVPVFAHRLLMAPEASLSGRTAIDVVTEIVHTTAVASPNGQRAGA